LLDKNKAKERAKRYKERNPERAAAKQREASARYRLKHSDRVKAARKAARKKRSEYLKKWREQNREHANEQAREYYAKEPEKYRAKSAKYREDNPEKVKEQNKAQRLKNLEPRRKHSREYYHRNRAAIQRKKIRTRLKNPDAIKLRDRKRYSLSIARKFGCRIGDVKEIAKFYHDTLVAISVQCYYCEELCGKGHFISAQIDHKTPLCKGGDHDVPNLARTCMTCNVQKGKMTEREFYEYRQVIKEVKEELKLENEALTLLID
jgi:5-methylcytosine-specific restriction endonuclease McrA